MFHTRTQDAYDAKSFLSEIHFVDRNRIALMGFSHGGAVVLNALNKLLTFKNKDAPFKAAIAFYPNCDILKHKDALLMILIGELDDWTRAVLCSERMPSGKTEHEIILKIYPGAYHGFDRIS